MVIGQCAKVTTRATIICVDGRRYVGENWCANPQPECPRNDGEGYEKCKSVCWQYGHAEEMACKSAGSTAYGGTLYLEGHTYVCDSCKKACDDVGIKKIIIGKPPEFKNRPALSVKK